MQNEDNKSQIEQEIQNLYRLFDLLYQIDRRLNSSKPLQDNHNTDD